MAARQCQCICVMSIIIGTKSALCIEEPRRLAGNGRWVGLQRQREMQAKIHVQSVKRTREEDKEGRSVKDVKTREMTGGVYYCSIRV